MATKFPVQGNPVLNQLEEFVFGKPKDDKRGERMARSENARKHRRKVKELKEQKEKD